jgi:hypothetical protein
MKFVERRLVRRLAYQNIAGKCEACIQRVFLNGQ